jgi:hypothetical protein
MSFWPVFYPELTWVFDLIKSSQYFLYFFLNLDQFRPQINSLSQLWFYKQGYCNIINSSTWYKPK